MMTTPAEVFCLMPDPDTYERTRGDEPPDEWGAWRTESGQCTHEYCLFADQQRQLYRATAQNVLSKEEREEIESDTELMRDEFHGRDLDGRIR